MILGAVRMLVHRALPLRESTSLELVSEEHLPTCPSTAYLKSASSFLPAFSIIVVPLRSSLGD